MRMPASSLSIIAFIACGSLTTGRVETRGFRVSLDLTINLFDDLRKSKLILSGKGGVRNSQGATNHRKSNKHEGCKAFNTIQSRLER